MKTGIELIAIERQRQIEIEGWTVEHDKEHQGQELAMAAALYAMPECKRHHEIKPYLWPWEEKWWKPTPENRTRELAKAGALIAAEIDRIQAI